MTLLRATEDLESVSSRVYERAETLFQAAMSDYHGPRVATPQDLSRSLLRNKTTSNGEGANDALAGSSYGMVDSHGSVRSEGEEGRNGDGDEGEGRSTTVRRGWDWRKGLAMVAGKSAKGADVVRLLRVQVARELAGAWGAEA